jgi:hypothetical protein
VGRGRVPRRGCRGSSSGRSKALIVAK